MQNKSKFKIQRRLGVVLPGFGDKAAKGPLSKRPYPPGMHGQGRGRKVSEFGIRLKEKQKIIYHYGVKEKQLITLIKKAKRKQSNWFDELTAMLECRLDNVLFRLGFFPTIQSARQVTVHGHVLVNGKKCDIPSYIVQLGDKISLKEKTYKNALHVNTRKEPTLELPEFLQIEDKKGQGTGEVVSKPNTAHIPFEIQHQYVIEYYGKVK